MCTIKENGKEPVEMENVYNSQEMEAPKYPSMNKWINQVWSVYTMEYYSV